MKEHKNVEQIAHITVGGEQSSVKMSYSAKEPYAVNFTFLYELPEYQQRPWIFGRELLEKGLRVSNEDPVGDGDVKLGTSKTEEKVIITLQSPYGSADISINQVDVVNFLKATDKIVPMGREHKFYDLDREIIQLLNHYDD